MAQQALRACGLYKFWCLRSLRAKQRLLQMLVDYRDLDSESFHIDRMSLTIEVEDIYFITGLSRRGEVVNLRSRGARGGLTIDEYIVVYCYPDMEKFRSYIPTNSIQVLGLNTIQLTLSRIVGLASLDQASRPLMFYAMECMRPIVYDWINVMLSNMKQQLSDCKMGRV